MQFLKVKSLDVLESWCKSSASDSIPCLLTSSKGALDSVPLAKCSKWLAASVMSNGDGPYQIRSSEDMFTPHVIFRKRALKSLHPAVLK